LPKNNIHDFNKYDLLNNLEEYKNKSPCIQINYVIEHAFSYDNVDSAFSKLKKILVYNEDASLDENENGTIKIVGKFNLKFELDKQYENEYKTSMQDCTSYDDFIKILKNLEDNFSWNFYNTTNGEELDKNDIKSIFEIDSISATRNTGKMAENSKSYVNSKIKENGVNVKELNQEITGTIQEKLSSITKGINDEIEEDQSNIGVTNGKNKFVSNFYYEINPAELFIYELEDVEKGFSLPLENNGLGYNNLIFMRNLIKQKKDNDYNILLIEEPEAHLHPNMQYKLLKYIGNLQELKNEENQNVIKNQIIVTTHSSNITASIDLSEIIMLNYDRSLSIPNVTSITLNDNFDYDKVKNYIDLEKILERGNKTTEQLEEDIKKLLIKSSEHLKKFLDVTRSDILFSDIIILVEGIAEKLLLPIMNDKLVDEHIAVIELGGINFNYFLPLCFNTNKKVLCITDKDESVINIENKTINLEDYNNKKPSIHEIYTDKKEQICVVMQKNGGSTFEKEIFIDNYDDFEAYKYLMKSSLLDEYNDLIDQKSISYWKDNYENVINNHKTKEMLGRKINKYYEFYQEQEDEDNKKLIEKIFMLLI